MILEPAVALTDYTIAIESGLLAALLWRKQISVSHRWFVSFFAFIGLAAALGGTVHGFVPDETTVTHEVLWRATLITIGVVAFAAAMAAANSGWGRAVQRIVEMIAAIGFAIYCVAVLFFTQQYLAAIIVYLPATVFLLVSFIAAYFRARATGRERTRMLIGAAGMLLTFVAAGAQQSRIEIARLDHNALYHVIQAVALALIYIGAIGVARRSDPVPMK